MNRELFISDTKRYQRLYSADELAERMADYVAEHYMPRLNKDKAPDPSVGRDTVIRIVCEHFGKTLNEIVHCRRQYRIFKPKKILCFLLWNRTLLSQRDISIIFGYRDHTSVIHQRDSVLDLMRTDETWRNEIQLLNQKLNEKNQPENLARVLPDDLNG